jgi:hypothetical protein
MYGMDPAASMAATRRRQRQLGRQIRASFERLVNEAVPQDMLQLLDQIDSKQTVTDALVLRNAAGKSAT